MIYIVASTLQEDIRRMVQLIELFVLTVPHDVCPLPKVFSLYCLLCCCYTHSGVMRCLHTR